MPTGQADRLMPSLRRVVLARQSAARSDGDLLGAFVSATGGGVGGTRGGFPQSQEAGEAFAELVRRHGPMVLGVCRRVVGDRTTADDAFQATFLVLARRAAAVRPRERVGNWLYGVAYRTALKARTVLARRRSREKQVDVMPEPVAPAAPAVWTDLQPVIDEELARLPDKLRLPVVLCDLEGRPQREVAKHLNVAPATLATRLLTARRTLAARLTRRGVTLSGGALAGLLGTHGAATAVPRTLAAGVVRAVEAGAVNSLVSANALQLSEGVLRMMMLAKLKAVAVLAVTALALTTGLGLGLVPASAGDEPGPAAPAKAGNAAAGSPDNRPESRSKTDRPAPAADDATFLRRLCLDVRGTPPTDVETWFFVSDADADKRAKVVDWATTDDAAKLKLAKKLGVPPERVRVVQARLSADGRYVEIKVDRTGERVVHPLAPYSIIRRTAQTGGDAQLVADPNSLAKPETAIRSFATWVDPPKTINTNATGGYTQAIWAAVDEKTGKVAQPVVANPPAGGYFRTVGNGSDVGFVNELHYEVQFDLQASDSDAEFLKRALADVRNSAPTALETKYFTEDKDPKKREKLIDTLLKEPAVQKKLGDAWKAKMLEPKVAEVNATPLIYYWLQSTSQPPTNQTQQITLPSFNPTPPVPPAQVVKPDQPPASPVRSRPIKEADKFEKLVGELIAAKKSDEAILEAVTLATLSRLPTDSEKKLVGASIGSAADRKAAWVAVAHALSGTGEAKKPNGEFQINITVPLKPPAPPTPPVPPAKP